MRTSALIFLFLMPAGISLLRSQTIPAKMTECEGGQCVPGGGGPGKWTFTGRQAHAVWPGSGATANLTVERFDSDGVVIRRIDTQGRTPGITAVYTGKINGNRIEGDVTWSWPGHWNRSPSGKWFAVIGDATDASVEVTSARRPAPPAEPPRQATPDKPVKMPQFLKDSSFIYDFNGEWRLTYPPNAPRHPLFSITVLQKQGDFQMIVGDPNIYYPLGESMFNGRYVNGRITGDLMDAPAHRGGGYRGYAWSKAEIQIVDDNNLLLPGAIKMRRTDSELGANKPCDPVKYAHMDAAHTFIYGSKDYELGNYGNAACWLYLTASQGHHEAQLDLALLLRVGTGVHKDPEQSYLWFKKSAEQGNKRAQYLLANSYQSGVGVHQDLALARVWLAKANDGIPEPQLPRTQEDVLFDLVRSFESSVCAAPSLSAREGRTAEYEARRMSHSRAVEAARQDEAETATLCNSMRGYEPPPMPN